MQRNTYVYRINEWLLHLSDHESLTFEQKIERTGWIGSMIGSVVMVLIMVTTFLGRALQ